MKNVIWMLCLSCVACGVALPDLPPDLLMQQPSVVAIVPKTQATLPEVRDVQIRFSQPIDPTSLRPDSFAILPRVDLQATPDAIVHAWQEQTLVAVEGTYVVTPDGLEGRFVPSTPLSGNDHYAVIVGTSVHSQAGVPLSQTPGGSPTPFVSIFSTTTATDSEAATMSAGATETPVSPAASIQEGGQAKAPAAVRIVPAELMINEVYYDAMGTDTNGVLFVELRGTPEADVGGYVIHFVNGDGGVVTESLTIPDGTAIPATGLFVIADGMTGNLATTQVAETDLLNNFDPQNGPDAVQLVDPAGKIVDVVGYGMPLPLYGENSLPMYDIAPAPDAPADQSISRRPGTTDTDNNATDFVIGNPTPGKE